MNAVSIIIMKIVTSVC